MRLETSFLDQNHGLDFTGWDLKIAAGFGVLMFGDSIVLVYGSGCRVHGVWSGAGIITCQRSSAGLAASEARNRDSSNDASGSCFCVYG